VAIFYSTTVIKDCVHFFWRGSLYLLFCKYRDKKLRPSSHPALAACVGVKEKEEIFTMLDQS
jgi:hypothetical protein